MKTFFHFLFFFAIGPLSAAFALTGAKHSEDPAPEEHATELRRLDAPASEQTQVETLTPAATEQARVEESDDSETDEGTPPAAAEEKTRRSRHGVASKRHHDDDQVSVFANVTISSGQRVQGSAIAVMGDLSVDGEVLSDAVAVMGDNKINGVVHGQAVAIMGDITLGPKAHVMGDVVTVGGTVVRDPAATVEGKVVQQAIGRHLHVGAPVVAWWSHGLSRGRPLAFGAHLTWLWVIAVVSLLLYVLLAAVFPRAVRRCGDVLVERPALTILTALLSVLALPIFFVLLLVTIVGIPVALIALPLGVVLAVLFGKAGIYALVGRKLTGERWSLPLAAVLGAAIFIILYLVPGLGLVLSFLVSFLGFGCVVLALLTREKKSPATATPIPPSAAPVEATELHAPPSPAAAAETSIAATAPVVEMPVTPTESVPVLEGVPLPPPLTPVAPTANIPPPLTVTLPRVGFWLRTAALLIDLVLVGVITALLHAQGPAVILLLAAYGAVMWKLKGTTVGGVVCDIKVVRLDGRPIDWPTAVVRALGCFLSLAVAGLGFIWVAFDDEKQSWHDKIAGTTVVKVPKGTSLV